MADRADPAEALLSREEKIERLTNALWRTSEEKLDVIAAIIDL